MRPNIETQSENNLDFSEMDDRFFLIGLLNEFINRFQTVGDNLFKEMSWKQCFLMMCIMNFEKPPTLKELSMVMGCSHQNIKQMLLKLEKTGFVKMVSDEADSRKQRILLTEKAYSFSRSYDEISGRYVDQLFANIDPKKLEITIETIMQLDNQLKYMK